MQTPAPSRLPQLENRLTRIRSPWLISVLVATTLTLLAGCANTLTAKVTRFNQWPADAAGQTFSFTAAAAPRELEMGAYQYMVAAELQRLGLRVAPDGRSGRFVVKLEATLTPRERKQLEAVYSDDWLYSPLYRDQYGRLYGGHWVPDPWGPRYVGDREVTRTVQESRLQVRIEDHAAKPAQSVFDSTAVHEGQREDLVEVMPWLVKAMFTDFPGSNGQVRRITYDLK